MNWMRGASSVNKPAPIWFAWLCLLLCACGLAGPVIAQDKPLTAYFRETWTTRQGLPHNQVNAIAQTSDGYLWLGTWEGLVAERTGLSHYEKLLNRADALMYEAKRAGRNRIHG